MIAYPGIGEDEVERIAKERNYKNRDEIRVSKEGLGDAYESKIASFFQQASHPCRLCGTSRR